MSDGRTLTCTRCHEPVHVYELPVRFIDPELFICGRCLTPTKAEQLDLLDPEPVLPALVRSEERRYDPAISEIPL